MRKARVLFLTILLALPSPAFTADAGRAAVYAEIAQQEARLATISYRLTTGNAVWCPKVEPQPGWILRDLRQFQSEDRQAASQIYTPIDGPFVAAVAPGSPAGQANLKRGTVITAINGETIAPSGSEPTARIDTIIVKVSALDATSQWTATDKQGHLYQIASAPGCASAFRIELTGPQAAANGFLVRVTLDLARSIPDEGELAAVVAHELAHNILRHRSRLGSDRSAARVRKTEIEADRLSVWLMAGAGYDPAAAIRFWNQHKRPLIRAASHPPRAERIAAIEAEIADMQQARKADSAARPLWIDNPPPLE